MLSISERLGIEMKKDIYKQLTEEIMYNNSKQDTYTNYAYVIVAAVWSLAFSVQSEWIALIPLFVLIPICLRISDCRYSIAFLASYIKVFLEPELDAEWQTMHVKYYENNQRSPIQKILYHGSKLDIPFLSLISAVIFWLLRGSEAIFSTPYLSLSIIMIQLIIIIFDCLVCLKYSDISRVKEPLLQKWQELYDENNNESED